MSSLAEHFSLEEEMFYIVLITKLLCNINKTIETAKLNKDYSIKHFDGADKKYSLIDRKHKIVIPKLLEKQVVEWYHNALCHLGENCTELYIAQYFCWKNLRKTVHEVCSKYKACQFLKINKKQYVKLPPKEAESKTYYGWT